jgi:hypothetical protein
MGSIDDDISSHGVIRRFPRTIPSPVRFAAFAAICFLPLVARHVDFISPILPISISTSSGSGPIVYHSVFLWPFNWAKNTSSRFLFRHGMSICDSRLAHERFSWSKLNLIRSFLFLKRFASVPFRTADRFHQLYSMLT